MKMTSNDNEGAERCSLAPARVAGGPKATLLVFPRLKLLAFRDLAIDIFAGLRRVAVLVIVMAYMNAECPSIHMKLRYL